MQKNSFYKNLGIVLISLFILTILLLIFNIFINNTSKNILNNNSINQGVGWKNNQSFYSGSELSFIFNNSRKISFAFDTNSKADQGVEIFIDDISYIISSPNVNAQKLSITVDKNKHHTVTIRHFCTLVYDPCQIKLTEISLEFGAKITPYQKHTKIISVLGDSISTIYGRNNYSQILTDDLGYELHNASVIGSTISQTPNVDSAVSRYKKDITSFKSDIVIIFLGTNDASKNVSINVFEKNYSKIIFDIKKYNPSTKIFLVGLLKRSDMDKNIIVHYSSVIKNIAEKHKVNFIDPDSWLGEKDFSDDIHPSLESQKKLAGYFKDSLFSILK